MKNSLTAILCLIAIALSAQSKKEANKYLNQEQPTTAPIVFAPGVVFD